MRYHKSVCGVKNWGGSFYNNTVYEYTLCYVSISPLAHSEYYVKKTCVDTKKIVVTLLCKTIPHSTIIVFNMHTMR